MAKRESFLSLNVAVGDNPHECGHEYGYNTLHGEEPFYLGSQTNVAEVTAERGEICAPCCILEEIHQDEPDGKLSVFHYSVVC